MKKLSLIVFAAIISLFLAALIAPTPSYADQEIEVAPLSFDFGEVEVGSTSTNTITIYNLGDHPLSIYGIEFDATSDSGFSFEEPSQSVVAPGFSVDIEIEFAPTAEGPCSAVLVISSNDPDEVTVEVDLSGTGTAGGVTPPVSVEDILAFFDASVAQGTLVGSGPGTSADGRMKALRNMLEAAGDLIADGDDEGACEQLIDAYAKTDGDPWPLDFVEGVEGVEGDAASILAGMILDLMDDLGCP